MMTSHVSELAIDRMLAGELSTLDAASLRDHAAACARCNAALDDALATKEVLLPRLPIPRKRSYAPYLGGVAALAAALALVLAWPRHDDEAGTRGKGNPIAGFFVSHDGNVRRGAMQEAVMPGDRIELFTTVTEPMWFAAISSDGTVYAEPQPITPGQEVVLPSAIELDGTLANEVVTGMFCPQAFDPHRPPAECTIDRFTLVKVPR